MLDRESSYCTLVFGSHDVDMVIFHLTSVKKSEIHHEVIIHLTRVSKSQKYNITVNYTIINTIREMLTNAIKYWLTIYLKKIFMKK